MTAPVTHLSGRPGCGKRTIARALGRRIGARVLDDHLILDPAVALFRRRTAEQAALREPIRSVVLEAALSLPPEIPLVLTDALSDDDGKPLAPSIAFAERRGASFVSILLQLNHEENARGLTAADRRSTGKPIDAAILSDIRENEKLLTLPGSLHLNVDALSAEDAARLVEARLSGSSTDRISGEAGS